MRPDWVDHNRELNRDKLLDRADNFPLAKRALPGGKAARAQASDGLMPDLRVGGRAHLERIAAWQPSAFPESLNSDDAMIGPARLDASQIDRALTEPMQLSCLRFSRAGNIQSANLAAARLLGLVQHEMLEQQFVLFLVDADRTLFESMLGRVFATHSGQSCELQLLPRANAPALYVHIEARQGADSSDCLAVLTDITERKLAERFRAIRDRAIQELNQGIIIADAARATFPIIYVNDGFESLTGYSATEVVGRSLELLQGRDTDLNSLADVYQALRDSRSCTAELLLYRENGTTFWNTLQFTPICDDAGELLQYVACMSDVTERRQREERLRHSQKMEAVGQLAGGIAHGFNNLLTVIEGYSSLLLEAPEVFAGRATEFLTEIRSASARGAALTQQLLALGCRQLLHPESFDLNELIREIMGQLEGKPIRTEMVLDSQLRQIWADRAQISQVLMNLILNAREALSAGGRLTVRTQCVVLTEAETSSMSHISPGNYALLSVSDNGCGMSDAVRARAFEPFFTTKPQGKGIGLGLSAVHGVATQSGGHVAVTSHPGVGTCIYLYLPRDNMSITTAPSQSDQLSLSGTETVLLVEDEDAVRTIVSLVLNRYGYKVLEASSGSGALDIVKNYRQPIHMLITDVVMPGMHGPEVARAVVKQVPAIRVIFMSGYVDDARTREGLADPNASFIQKPFSSEELALKVREVLGA